MEGIRGVHSRKSDWLVLTQKLGVLRKKKRERVAKSPQRNRANPKMRPDLDSACLQTLIPTLYLTTLLDLEFLNS